MITPMWLLSKELPKSLLSRKLPEPRLKKALLFSFGGDLKLWIALFFTWMFSSALAETPSPPVIKNYLICKSRGQVRSVYVETHTAGCRTHYSKMGVSEVIGSGQNTNSCVQFLNNVRSNLEDASWTCKAAAKAHVSIET